MHHKSIGKQHTVQSSRSKARRHGPYDSLQGLGAQHCPLRPPFPGGPRPVIKTYETSRLMFVVKLYLPSHLQAPHILYISWLNCGDLRRFTRLSFRSLCWALDVKRLACLFPARKPESWQKEFSSRPGAPSTRAKLLRRHKSRRTPPCTYCPEPWSSIV